MICWMRVPQRRGGVKISETKVVEGVSFTHVDKFQQAAWLRVMFEIVYFDV